jgi:RimJ/RimL family protein N-acetyltransferase
MQLLLSFTPIGLHEDRNRPEFNTGNCIQLIDSMYEFYQRVGFHPPWIGYFAWQNGIVVGTGAFVGRPENNRVEISYWTFPEMQGNGIASETCRKLIEIARTHQPGIVITAKTEPRENASTRVLQKNGFVYSQIVQDHEIGDAWEWVL